MTAQAITRNDIYVARQAIFDSGMNVRGYELLFRRDTTNQAGVIDHDMATAQVILNTFLDLGLDGVVGEHKAFLNLTPSFLSHQLWQDLPPDRVVLEIVGNLKGEAALEATFGSIKAAGFEICLDDYRHMCEPQRYLQFASYAKLDVLDGDMSSFPDLIQAAQKHKVRTIAKRVENQDAFQECLAAGCDLFQGHFFSSPANVVSNEVPQNRTALMRLLAEIQSPDLGLDRIDEVIQQDLALTYKLLRFVNSPLCGLRAEIESIKQASIMVGLHRIKTWATLILLGGIDNKPKELLEIALIRGKMCELLAQARGEQKTDSFYLTGLLSTIGVILDTPLPKAVSKLPLADEIKNAILHHQGIAGEILKCVLSYERTEWKDVRCGEVNPTTIRDAYLRSLRWSRGVFASIEQ